ncbi:MAG: ATP-binding cassette domain-containing protein [Actinobacteria bacterium]|nr:ATP-binding cassette domain-containing protein [Actinomycetota bacterium]
MTFPLGFEVPPEAMLGLVTGLTYGLLGVGITLIYKANRILNFAYGEMGALTALLFVHLVAGRSWPYWVALPVALAVAGAVGAAIEVGIIRRLARTPRLLVLVATIGLAQLLFVLSTLVPREGLGQASFPLPFAPTIQIGSVTVPPGHVLILVAAPVITAAIALFLRRSRIGLASRAAADNEDAAQLTGIPVHRISLAIWILAGILAVVGAILVGPTRPVLSNVATGPDLMLRGLTAAVFGGLVSLPMTLLGGVLVGVAEFLVLWNYPTGGALELVLLVLVVGLVLWRTDLGATVRDAGARTLSLVGSASRLRHDLAADPRVRRARRAAAIVAVVVLGLLPLALTNSHRVLLSTIALFAAMGCTLVLLTGYAGQVSLGQFAFVAIGAVVGGKLHSLGYPPGTAVVWATAIGALVALVVGLPALRIRGLFLAVTTLSLAVFTSTWLVSQPWLVRDVTGASTLEIPRPELLGIDLQSELAYAWLSLGVLAVVGAIVTHIPRTGLGRSIVAVRDNEPSAASLSVEPWRAKLVTFVVSGALASFVGYFYGGLLVSFSSQPQEVFGPGQSLLLVAMVVFGGAGSVTGAIVGALFVHGSVFVMAPLVSSFAGDRIAAVLSGAGLLVAVLQFPQGLAAELFRIRDRIAARIAGAAPSRDEGSATTAPRLQQRSEAERAEPTDLDDALRCEDVVVRYGGITAVDGVTLHAAAGEIVGLVGPNGAGKTTLFDVLSGHIRGQAGRVLLHGEDISDLSPALRARLGLGRTFQQARLFDDLTVVETLQVGLERHQPYEAVPALLGLPPDRRDGRTKREAADDIVELFNLGEYAHRPIRELSTGTRRLVELATMVALAAPVLLLDEPAAGVAQREVEALTGVLQDVRGHLDATIVLIDHDVPMVSAISDRLYVLAAGRVIAEGDPDTVRDDPAVIEAYLGRDDRALVRSGT